MNDIRLMLTVLNVYLTFEVINSPSRVPPNGSWLRCLP